MSSSPLSNFTALDGLTQLIYQGPSRFVLITALDAAHRHWTIHLGLAGTDGRWWRGRWEKPDVFKLAGDKASDRVLEAFAEKVADTIVQSELYVSGWIPGAKKSANDLSLVIGPSAKAPLSIRLTELSPEEAAAQATNIFISIAVQAQSHKCQLYPSVGSSLPDVFATRPPPPRKRTRSPPPSPPRATTPPVPTVGAQPKLKSVARPTASTSSITRTAEQLEIENLRAQLAQAQSNAMASPTKGLARPQVNPRSINAVAARKPPKGASLANPNKKARVYQELEFEDD